MQPLILLAAGKSSRMGMPKGLIEYAGTTLLEYQLQQFKKAGGVKAFLILGTHVEEYRDRYQWNDDSIQNLAGVEVNIIINDRVEWGPFHSVKLGLSQNLESGALLSPIDSPLPSSDLIQKLWSNPKESCVPSFESRKGHPVWISSATAKDLIKLDSQSNRLDHLLKDVNVLECQEEKTLLNINTPQDLHPKAD